MTERRAVITGIGVISPLGNSVEEVWEGALSGKSGVGQISRFDASQFSSTIAAEVKNFDPEVYLDRKEVKKHDLFSQYAIGAADQAMKDSGLDMEKEDSTRIGSILGVGIGGISSLEKYHELYLSGGPRKISPFLIPAMISNLGPGNIAIRFGLKGVNWVITSACTSATHAIGESARLIKHGIQDIVVTGGTESSVSTIGVGGFCAMKALSTRNDDPTRASRPFDAERDGFVLGEGSAILVVEELERAKARGTKIYAEVLGLGASCDAYHLTAPAPGGEGAINSMKSALADAKINPEQVDYINAHGTSTAANDKTETAAIKEVFGDYARKVNISSTKSMTGHLLGAAGAIEALLSTLAIQNSVIPPTINLENPDPECDLDYCPNQAREVSVDYAISNSFGFGGTNGTLVIGKF